MPMAITETTVAESCAAAKRAARILAGADTAAKNAALEAAARLLVRRDYYADVEKAQSLLEAGEFKQLGIGQQG